MRKIILSIACVAATLCSYAQQMGSNRQPDPGSAIELRLVDDGFGVGCDFLFNYINAGMYYDFYKAVDIGSLEMNHRDSWGIYGGGNYRYWFSPSVFVEGRAGIGFDWYSYSLEGKTSNITPSSDNELRLFAYLQPRAGVKILSTKKGDISIVAGYRLDFIKFKTGSDNTKNYFTIGVAASM